MTQLDRSLRSTGRPARPVCQHGEMGLSARLLGRDERVVLRLRTHGKALIWPALGLVLTGLLLGAGTALVPSAYRPAGQYAVAVAVCALALWWSVVPFLRWRSRTYTITNHRLVTRAGILHRTGVDLPLLRVVDVSYQRSLVDRMLGCGTLVIQNAAESQIVLDDVPDVQYVHQVLTGLLFDTPPAVVAPAEAPRPGPGRRSLARAFRLRGEDVLSGRSP